ncbi:MAG: hypothetical protein ACL93V_15435 [Candidatus Electrothrix sp. YB6]
MKKKKNGDLDETDFLFFVNSSDVGGVFGRILDKRRIAAGSGNGPYYAGSCCK